MKEVKSGSYDTCRYTRHAAGASQGERPAQVQVLVKVAGGLRLGSVWERGQKAA